MLQSYLSMHSSVSTGAQLPSATMQPVIGQSTPTLRSNHPDEEQNCLVTLIKQCF